MAPDLKDRNLPTEGRLLIGLFEVEYPKKPGIVGKRFVHGPVTDYMACVFLLRLAETEIASHLLSLNVHVGPPAAGPLPGAGKL